MQLNSEYYICINFTEHGQWVISIIVSANLLHTFWLESGFQRGVQSIGGIVWWGCFQDGRYGRSRVVQRAACHLSLCVFAERYKFTNLSISISMLPVHIFLVLPQKLKYKFIVFTYIGNCIRTISDFLPNLIKRINTWKSI